MVLRLSAGSDGGEAEATTVFLGAEACRVAGSRFGLGCAAFFGGSAFVSVAGFGCSTAALASGAGLLASATVVAGAPFVPASATLVSGCATVALAVVVAGLSVIRSRTNAPPITIAVIAAIAMPKWFT